MAKIENLESIKAKVSKIVEAKNAERAACIEKYEIALKRKEEALEEAQKAYEEANTSAYHAAQDKIRESSDAANMFKDRADIVERSPYITQAEFNELLKKIEDNQDKKIEADREQLAGAFRLIRDIYKREDQEIGEINDFIKYLQLEVLKKMPGLTANNGLFIEQPSKIPHYLNTRLLGFLHSINDESIFNEILRANPGE